MRRWQKVLAVTTVTLSGLALLCPVSAPAQGGACTASCRAQHNQCRIATKGSPSCDAQFAACMRSCIASKGR